MTIIIIVIIIIIIIIIINIIIVVIVVVVTIIIECLEKIQDRFTALACRNAVLSHAQRMRDFSPPTHRTRRTALDLVK